MNKKAFTLIEVLVASAVMLVLFVLAGGALWTGGRSSTRGIEKLDEISKISRLGEYLKKCLRFAVQVEHLQPGPELEEYQVRFVEEISPIDGTRVEKDASFKFSGPPRGAKHVEIVFAGRPQPMDFDQLDLRMSITGNLIAVQLDGGKNRVLEVAVTSPYMVALSGFTGNPLEGLGASAGAPDALASGGSASGLPAGTPLAGLPGSASPAQGFVPPLASSSQPPGVEGPATRDTTGGLGALGSQLGTGTVASRDKPDRIAPPDESPAEGETFSADGGTGTPRSLARMPPRLESRSEPATITPSADPPLGFRPAEATGSADQQAEEEEPAVIASDDQGITIARTPPGPPTHRLDQPVKPVKPVKPLRPTMTAPPSIVPPTGLSTGVARSRLRAPTEPAGSQDPTIRRSPPALPPSLQAILDRLRETPRDTKPPKDPAPEKEPDKPNRQTEPLEAAPAGEGGMNQPFN